MLEFSLVARLKHVAGAFGQDALEQFHRQMAYVATLFLLAHPILLLASGYPFEVLNPVSSGNIWAWRWGAIAFCALLVLLVLSMGYKLFRMSYEWWHATHRLLAPAVLIAALLHIFMVNGFTGTPPMKTLWIAYTSGFLGITIYHRVYMPLRIWQRPWRVVRNVPELGDARTLVLQPVGHQGLSFDPGQFAWMSMGKTPFHGEEHPISFSSSAEKPIGAEVSFTIKALGDWSNNVVPKI